MTKKIINSAKYLLVFTLILFSVIACEKDFENIGVNIVDNNLFNTSIDTFEVIAYTSNVERSEVIGDNVASGTIDGLPVFNIGILKVPNFGTLKASFISQVQRPFNGLDFGLNPVIDTVILDIPYFATRTVNNDDNTPNFELDSIFGNRDIEYTLKVHRLKTFLNTLDPSDPTQNKRYFSDEDYEKLEELHLSNFKPNKNDTVLYVTRSLFEGTQATDTIKKDDLSPSIKLALNKQLIKNIFIDNITEADDASSDAFLNYFRGLLIEPVQTSADGGSIMQLAINDATISIYYTFDLLTDETTADLNGDGDTDDLQVPVKTKGTLSLLMSGIRTATYERDPANLFENPNVIDGEANLFVQGAAGSMAIIDLSKELDEANLAMIRSKGWLINGAILDVYVDNDMNSSELYTLPARLYMYKIDDNTIIEDVITEGQVNGIGGFLSRTEDGTPEKYQFLMTDYISNILKAESDNPSPLSKLAIKMHHITDNPLSLVDTIVRDFSWDPKGVALKGNLFENGNERVKLIIYYTEDPQ